MSYKTLAMVSQELRDLDEQINVMNTSPENMLEIVNTLHKSVRLMRDLSHEIAELYRSIEE